MRQAGRSLPDYRRIRQRYGIMDICRQPELCASVTCMPVDLLGVDAAVLFADIMLPLGAIGVDYELVESVGPVVAHPLRIDADVHRLGQLDPDNGISFVMDAIRACRQRLNGKVPLIGFAGAPFTLAGYLIEGRPSRQFTRTKALMYREPATWHLLMEHLTEMTITYLRAQAAAGAQALQLFDSWVGALAPDDYAEFVLPYSERIFSALADLQLPRIHFATASTGLISHLAAAGSDVIGVDWRVDLAAAWDQIGDRAIQGNLDPLVLLGPRELVVERALRLLRSVTGRPGHIFNLGHGVHPQTPIDNLRTLVETVHAWRPASHQR